MEDLVVDANCVVASASASARSQETANGLPRDIVASILVRLPGSDLRRLRRVCKEWRDIIVDPTFIQEFLIHGSRAPPTHTIIFFESQKGPRNGRGFLFDEQWRLTADFTPGVQDRLVGACNGLLCFLEAGQGCIKIVEPSTGESLALPLPSEASGLRWTVNPAAYCFGYDATTNGYKIMHHNYLAYVTLPLRPGEAIVDEELHVHTIGGGEGWRRLHVAFSVYGRAYADPLYVDGSVYWPTRGHGEHRREEKLVRFDLAKEKITSEATVRMRLEIPRPETAKLCRLVDSKTSCVMTYGRNCEWDAWFPKAETEQEPVFPGGLVLSTDWIVGVGGLYLRRIERGLEFGPRELLFEAGKEDPCQRAHEYNGRTSFVPVPAHRRQLRPIAGAPPRKHCQVQAFGYSPMVSAAPLALYLGMPTLPEHRSAGHVPQEQTHLLSFCNGC